MSSNIRVNFEKSDGTIISPRSFSVSIESEKNIDYCYITCSFFEDYSSYQGVKFGDLVTVKEIDTNKVIFKGKVVTVPRNRDSQIVNYEFECVSFWERSKRLLVNKKYQNTLISEIITELIDEYSNETGISPGRIDPTNFPIEEMEFIEEPLFNVVDRLAEMINFYIKVNRDDNTFDFTRTVFTQNYLALYESNIVRGTSQFRDDASRLCNRLVIFGEADDLGNETKATVDNQTSINKYGLQEDTVRISDTNKVADLQLYGQNHLEVYAEILKVGTCQVIEDRGWSAGELIEVYLPKLNLNGEQLRITGIRKDFPFSGDLTTTLYFNETPEISATMSQINNRLKQFEKKQEKLVNSAKNRTMEAVKSDYYDKTAIDGMLGSGGGSGTVEYVGKFPITIGTGATTSTDGYFNDLRLSSSNPNYFNQTKLPFTFTKSGVYEVEFEIPIQMKSASALPSLTTDNDIGLKASMVINTEFWEEIGRTNQFVPYRKTTGLTPLYFFTLKLKSVINVNLEARGVTSLGVRPTLWFKFMTATAPGSEGNNSSITVGKTIASDFLTDNFANVVVKKLI